MRVGQAAVGGEGTGGSEFRLFLAARLLSDAGDRMVFVILAFAALHLGAAPGEVGLVLLARELPVVLGVLTGGVVGGRIPHKHALVIADALRCLAQAFTAILLLTEAAGLLHLAALQAATASVTALSLPLSEAMVAEVVPATGRQRANALVGMVRSITRVAAPAGAGAMVALVGVPSTFTLTALAFALSAGLMLRLQTRPAPLGQQRWSLSLKVAVSTIRHSKWLLRITGVSALTNALCLAPVLVLGPIIAQAAYDGAVTWTIIFTGFGLGATTGGVAMLRLGLRYPLRGGLWTALLLFLFPAALATTAPVSLITLGAFLAGVQSTVFNTVTETARQNHFPPDVRVQASALTAVIAFGSMPLGMAVAGWLAEASAPSTVLWFGAAGAIVAPLWGLAGREVRELQVSPPATRGDGRRSAGGLEA